MEPQEVSKNSMGGVLRRIQYYRAKKNIESDVLSLALGRHEKFIYQIERGDTILRVSDLLEIADYLKVSPIQLIAPASQEACEALEIVDKLPEENKRPALELLRAAIQTAEAQSLWASTDKPTKG